MHRRHRVRRGLRRALAVLVLAGLLPLSTTGCFGTFELTRKVYGFNQRVDPDQWIQWLAFLALTVVPIYQLSIAIDVLFANSVEFWTGDNPIAAAGGRRAAVAPDGTRAVATRNGDVIDLELTAPDGTTSALRFVRGEGELRALDAEGRLLARVVDVGGTPRLLRAGAR